MSEIMPTRGELIELCDRGVVPVEKWWDRDSPDAQKQLAHAGALLKAGADWRLSRDPQSTDRTWWLMIRYPSFASVDWGGDYNDDLFYIPTASRLARVDGGDWY